MGSPADSEAEPGFDALCRWLPEASRNTSPHLMALERHVSPVPMATQEQACPWLM